MTTKDRIVQRHWVRLMSALLKRIERHIDEGDTVHFQGYRVHGIAHTSRIPNDPVAAVFVEQDYNGHTDTFSPGMWNLLDETEIERSYAGYVILCTQFEIVETRPVFPKQEALRQYMEDNGWQL